MPTPTLDVLFLTNFSDFCFRAIPAVAQMADRFAVKLTLLHAFDPARTTRAQAAAKLHSFFPEADLYRSCQRLAVPGPVMEVVRRHLELWPVNLIVAPASDPIGLPRLGDRSLRAQLISECGVPLWTLGRSIQFSKLLQPPRNVACWLGQHDPHARHLPFAIQYAQRLQAKLHLIRPLPPVHEGSLLHPEHQTEALRAPHAAREVAHLCPEAPGDAHVHVVPGDGRAVLRRMVGECEADVVFLPNEESFVSRWLGLGLRLSDMIPCPAIYVGEKVSVPVWKLNRDESRVAVA